MQGPLSGVKLVKYVEVESDRLPIAPPQSKPEQKDLGTETH